MSAPLQAPPPASHPGVDPSLDEVFWGSLQPGHVEIPRFHEILRDIREQEGVVPGWFAEGMPCFVVTRHEDIRDAFLDTATFSPRATQEMLSFPVTGPTFLGYEGDQHTAYRKIVARSFTKRDIGTWVESMLRPQAQRIVDGFAATGSAELMADFGKVFPMAIISEMLGLPIDDWPQIAQWAHTVILGDDSSSREESEQNRAEAGDALRRYVRPVIAARREKPGDDLLSDLVTGKVDGRALTDEEVVSFLLLLFPAGVDTTWLAIGAMMTGVLGTPGAFDALRAQPELRQWAVEESLRWETPIAVQPRVTIVDTTVAGVPIPHGSLCMLAIAAANREPERFPDPDHWQIDRRPVGHITFGFGEHFCLGAHLARAEMIAALDVFTERLPNMRLASQPRFHGASVRGPDAVQVTF